MPEEKQFCINCARRDSCPDPSTLEANDYACFRSEDQIQELNNQ